MHTLSSRAPGRNKHKPEGKAQRKGRQVGLGQRDCSLRPTLPSLPKKGLLRGRRFNQLN